MPHAGTVQYLPRHSFSGSVQRWRSRRITSFSRPPRSANGTPVAANSSGTQPAPAPTIRRPAESRSSVASSRAISTGGRSAIWLTLVPSRTRSVTAAMKARPIHGSTIGSYGCGRSSGVTTRSLSHTESKPRRSASSAARLRPGSFAGSSLTPTFMPAPIARSRMSCIVHGTRLDVESARRARIEAAPPADAGCWRAAIAGQEAGTVQSHGTAHRHQHA